jgi:hypothetical protein
MPFVTIRWGANPADAVEAVNYSFDSHAKRDSFLEGVEAANGWMEYTVVASDADEGDGKTGYHCDKCGSGNVEACLPAFFDANRNFEYCSFDVEAETLFWYCNECAEPVAVVKPTGEIERGRWS